MTTKFRFDPDVTGSFAEVRDGLDAPQAEPAVHPERAMAAASIGAEDRRKMADQGVAMPDGSYPIPDKQHLASAILLIGKADPSQRQAVKAHIIKRARALGAVDLLPKAWNVTA